MHSEVLKHPKPFRYICTHTVEYPCLNPEFNMVLRRTNHDLTLITLVFLSPSEVGVVCKGEYKRFALFAHLARKLKNTTSFEKCRQKCAKKKF